MYLFQQKAERLAARGARPALAGGRGVGKRTTGGGAGSSRDPPGPAMAIAGTICSLHAFIQ